MAISPSNISPIGNVNVMIELPITRYFVLAHSSPSTYDPGNVQAPADDSRNSSCNKKEIFFIMDDLCKIIRIFILTHNQIHHVTD